MLFTSVNETVATTLKNYSGLLTDNITTNQVVLWWLGKLGGIETRNGGLCIAESIIGEDNASVQSYSGADPLNTTASEAATQAEYEWKQVAGVTQITGLQQFQNSAGPTQIVNLWNGKMMQLATTMRRRVNTMLYSDGSGNNNKDIMGALAAIENGDNWSTYGQIDSNANTWWRNVFVDAPNYTASTNFLDGVRSLVVKCTAGPDAPHLITTTQLLYLYFLSLLEQKEQFIRVDGDEEMARAGFKHFTYMGIPVVWDEDMLPNTTGDDAQGMVAWNLNYAKFVIGEGRDFAFTDPVTPDDQDLESVKCLLIANLALTNRRRQGRADFATT
ncbi:MAG TPA: phage major capsid protein [Blastocatellia bacterium]|nr:phage major capsid protein [Blastocatellia bacterium]